MRRIFFVIILLPLVINCQTSNSDFGLSDTDSLACPAEPSADTCQLYRCVEIDRKCGATGYPLQYGGHYCQRFLNLCDNTLFTEAEKKWARASVQCLQSATYEAQFLGDACDAIAAKGIEAHNHCYTAGAQELEAPTLCALGPDSWRRLRGCIDQTDPHSRRGLRQLAITLAGCSDELKNGLIEQGDSVDTPDPTVLNEWASEAQSLAKLWLVEAED